jgi:hypothetical protein
MTAKKVLTDIYNSKEMALTIKKVRPAHLQQDILQHVFCELFSQSDESIMDLFNRGKLRPYIAQMVWNVSRLSPTNKFTKQMGFKEDNTDFNEYCNEAKFEVIKFSEDEKERIESESEIKCAVSQLHWYKSGLLSLYAELGTYKAVSDKTGIPVISIWNTIKKARKEVKQII